MRTKQHCYLLLYTVYEHCITVYWYILDDDDEVLLPYARYLLSLDDPSASYPPNNMRVVCTYVYEVILDLGTDAPSISFVVVLVASRCQFVNIFEDH